MFARVPSVLSSDALGHEIVPFSTLASRKPKFIAHPKLGEVAFPARACLCAAGLSVCFQLHFLRVFTQVFVDEGVC